MPRYSLVVLICWCMHVRADNVQTNKVFVFMQDEMKFTEEAIGRAQGQAQFLTRVIDCGPFAVRITPPVPQAATNKRVFMFGAMECSACGIGFTSDDMIGVCKLPCAHTYHLYCFGMVCWLGDQCIEQGCNEQISEPVKKRICCLSMCQPATAFKTPKSKIHLTLCFCD